MHSGNLSLGAPSSSLPPILLSDLTNSPNPFDSRGSGALSHTAISYTLAQPATVTVTIFDLIGAAVQAWDFRPGENGARQGRNSVIWDGTNASGQKVSKGGYLAQVVVTTGQNVVTAVRKIGVIH